MTVKLAENNFGQIGRLMFRHRSGHEGYEVVSVNDTISSEITTCLSKYDILKKADIILHRSRKHF